MEEDSIFLSIKKLVGINSADTEFDLDVMIQINAVFSKLYQLGVGKDKSYRITSSDDKWTEVFEDYLDLLDFIKSYTYIKVRLIFDPPSSSFVLDALSKEASELEWRINDQADYPKSFDENEL